MSGAAESRRYQPIVDGLLAKDRDERFQSAAEALAGIEWVEVRSSSRAAWTSAGLDQSPVARS